VASQSIHAAPLAPMRFPARLPLLDAYILREMAAPFSFALAAFFLFWFLNIFFLAAQYIINAHANPLVVFKFLLFRIPQSVQYAFPFACLLATLLGFGRLVADHEVTALRTAGVKLTRIARTPLALGFAIFVFTAIVNDSLVPGSVAMSTRTFYQMIYNTSSLPVVPQFFRKDPATGQVFYVGDVEPDQRTMDNVMIFSPATNSAFREVINAEKAHFEGRNLVLQGARIVRFRPSGGLESAAIASRPIVVPLPMQESADQFLASGDEADPFMMSSKNLKSQIDSMENTGQGGRSLQLLKLNFADRLSFPFASLIAVIIALPLSVMFGSKGRALGFGISILVFFAYYLIYAAAQALGSSGVLNPFFAAWIPNVLAGASGAALFWRTER
jgi:lipopolysaccharide export system permease protein